MPILEMSAELLDLDPSQSWTNCNQNTFFEKSVEPLPFHLQFEESVCYVWCILIPKDGKKIPETHNCFFLLQMLTKVVTEESLFIDKKANKRAFVYRRACALRALGLLLADGVLTVGWGKIFWHVGRVPTQKRP